MVDRFYRRNNFVYTNKMTGKMTWMCSASTSPLCNPFCCQRRQGKLLEWDLKYSNLTPEDKPRYVCSNCYSCRRMFPSQKEFLKDTTMFLTGKIHSSESYPVLNAGYFRLESFGDLINEIHFENYCNLCEKNPQTKFALWTKNPFIIDPVLKRRKKPENLIIVQSSPFLNVEIKPAYDFVDKVFTVYTKDFITDNNVQINCGKKRCMECKLCYEKNGCTYIREKLK